MRIRFQLFPVKSTRPKLSRTCADALRSSLGLSPIEVALNWDETRHRFAMSRDDNLLVLLDPIQQRFEAIFSLRGSNMSHDSIR
jgi:hypothetical protein